MRKKEIFNKSFFILLLSFVLFSCRTLNPANMCSIDIDSVAPKVIEIEVKEISTKYDSGTIEFLAKYKNDYIYIIGNPAEKINMDIDGIAKIERNKRYLLVVYGPVKTLYSEHLGWQPQKKSDEKKKYLEFYHCTNLYGEWAFPVTEDSFDIANKATMELR